MSFKVSGFTICRNSVKLGFPFRESILSLAPLCEEIVIALDDQGDGTGAAIEELRAKVEPACKLVIVKSPWDMNNIKSGQELSRQTNIALDACQNEIVFYLQSDEVIHEEDYSIIKKDLQLMNESKKVASLSLTWLHFYGDIRSVVFSRKWYRREIRAFKKSSGLRSYLDAQGFRIIDANGTRRLPTLLSKARIFHYGYVRPPDMMAKKSNENHKQWSGKDESFTAEDIYREQFGIRPYEQTHPAIMKSYIEKLPKNQSKAFEVFAPKKFALKHLRFYASDAIEKVTGHRLGEFKNYSKVFRPEDL
jgi:glycosyltransferase involved in cell wall biosynthesis